MRSFTEAATDAVARAIVGMQREAARDRELREAEHRARLAELEARLSAVAEIERRLTDRIATLKDGEPGPRGEPGPSVDGNVLKAMIAEAVAGIPAPMQGEPGPPGRDGEDADMVALAGLIEERVAQAVAALPPAEKGEPGEPGRDADMVAVRAAIQEEVSIAVAALPPAEPGKDGEPGRDGRDIEDIEVTQNGNTVELAFTLGEVRSAFELELLVGLPGPPGEPGPAGAPGVLPTILEWTDDVHRQGDVVTYNGSVYQATKDTGKEPSHGDWRCVISRGLDGAHGKTPQLRGLFSEEAAYSALDVVMLNGASFAAVHDEPGPCPGNGWRLFAAQGKQGRPGPPGEKGDPGSSSKSVIRADISPDGLLTLTNADGSQVSCDFYDVLTRAGR